MTLNTTIDWVAQQEAARRRSLADGGKPARQNGTAHRQEWLRESLERDVRRVLVRSGRSNDIVRMETSGGNWPGVPAEQCRLKAAGGGGNVFEQQPTVTLADWVQSATSCRSSRIIQRQLCGRQESPVSEHPNLS
ncbi:MAG TPA: hypothetical protein VHU21_15075 [Paraburkholderia sp.]|nr:hypothetical protein [Paraburkholderia sp.]